MTILGAVISHWPLPVFLNPDFPHRLALLPGSVTLENLGLLQAAFLIDPDCGIDTLNGSAFATQLAAQAAITLHAAKARDLRPFLRRKAAFAARGYRLEMLA